MKEEYASDAINALRNDTAEGRFLLNVEYKVLLTFFFISLSVIFNLSS